MIVRVPDYFSEFSCIAGDCKDSCCLGWEIDIDEDSYEYYQTLPGEVGEHSFIKTSCGFANVRGGSEELKTRRLFRTPENKKSKIEGNTK